jgi:hypothetical protein
LLAGGRSRGLARCADDPTCCPLCRRLGHEYAVAEWRAIEPVRRAFTDDELIYADYRRHTEGHPTQRSYDVRMNGGRINDRHGVPALGREFNVTELEAAIVRVLEAYPNEAAIAVAFARRIGTLMPTLVAVMRNGARST